MHSYGDYVPLLRRELVNYWAEEFEKAQRLAGEEQQKHLKWADVPIELIKRWTAERRRSTKRIHMLEVEAQRSATE